MHCPSTCNSQSSSGKPGNESCWFFTVNGTSDLNASRVQESGYHSRRIQKGDDQHKAESQQRFTSNPTPNCRTHQNLQPIHANTTTNVEHDRLPNAVEPARPRLPTALLLNIQCLNPSAISNTKWKLPYLKNYIALDKNKSYPIIALTETWLKTRITDAQVHLPGYEVIRCDRSSRKGGGVLLYLADQLPATYIKTFDDKFCQAIACTCETSKTLILLIYRPPNADTQSTRKLFKFLKEYISEVNEDDGYDIMLLSDCRISSGQQHPCWMASLIQQLMQLAHSLALWMTSF